MDFDPSSAAPVGGGSGTFDPDSAQPLGTNVSQKQSPQGSGIAHNFTAGINEGLADTLGAPVDLINWLGQHNPVTSTVNAASRALGYGDVDKTNELMQKYAPKAPVGGSESIKKAMGVIGANPDDVQAVSTPEKVARGVGQGVSSAVIPVGGEVTVGKALANAATGGAMGAGGAAAAQVVPDKYKPIASTLGALLTGVATHGVSAAASGASTVSDILKTGTRDVRAAVSPAAAEEGAAAKLAHNATNLEDVKASLSGGAKEIVPGSTPTTFQQTGDQGLGSLERAQAVQNPGAFKAAEAERNVARAKALGAVQEGGAPSDLTSFFNSQFKELDAQTAQHVDALHATAQQEAARTGGLQTPDAYGASLRGVTNDALSAAKTRERGLWDAVDPDKSLTGNVQATKSAADEIAGRVVETEKPMDGEEAAIFKAAQNLKPITPVDNLVKLRSRVSAAMAEELATHGTPTPAYARLTQLRGAIQNNLSDTISHQVVKEADAVKAGTMSADDTTLARLKGWQDDFYATKSRAAGGEDMGAPAPAGAAPADSGGGAALPAAGGPGVPPGNPAVSPDTPTFDEAGTQRLAAATAATKERARTFGTPAVSSVIAKAGASDLYRLPEAKVPEKFFHPGPTGFADVNSLVNAVGRDRAMPIIQDYAASSLRKAAMRDDGTLDPKAFRSWSAKHSDALRALPDQIRSQFSTAALAAQAVEDATALRATALKDAQGDAIGKLMGAQFPEDVTRTVGSIFGAKDSVAQMEQIARAAAKDRTGFATQGLRQAVADHIASKFISNREAGATGISEIKADQFQTFIKQNRAALSKVFKPEEVQNIQAIADDLQRESRSVNATKLKGGSNTAQDTFATANLGPKTKTLLSYLSSLGPAVGGLATGHAITGLVASVGVHTWQAMKDAGIKNINDLVTKAMVDPDVARALLQKVPPKPNIGSAAVLSKALRRAAAVAAIQNVANRTQGTAP